MLYDKLNCTCAIETVLHKHMSVTVTFVLAAITQQMNLKGMHGC